MKTGLTLHIKNGKKLPFTLETEYSMKLVIFARDRNHTSQENPKTIEMIISGKA